MIIVKTSNSGFEQISSLVLPTISYIYCSVFQRQALLVEIYYLMKYLGIYIYCIYICIWYLYLYIYNIYIYTYMYIYICVCETSKYKAKLAEKYRWNWNNEFFFNETLNVFFLPTFWILPKLYELQQPCRRNPLKSLMQKSFEHWETM